MSMPDAFKNILCQAFTDNVDHMSLHTASPGTTGANDSGVTHAVMVWVGPSAGLATSLVTFLALSGDFTHVGLWEGSTFRQGIECAIHYTAPADVAIMVTHEADEDEAA